MLDVGKNLIDDVSGIGALDKLSRLFLDRNNITHVDGIETLSGLEELDLSYNILQSTAPIATLDRLRRLNLAHTGITQLSDILSLGDLDLLRISGNPDLACEEIAAATIEYGPTVIRSDQRCPETG
jgi:Leucine-rich repeat (LRR) protein